MSVSNDLRFDAMRDLRDVGCHANVTALNKVYNNFLKNFYYIFKTKTRCEQRSQGCSNEIF